MEQNFEQRIQERQMRLQNVSDTNTEDIEHILTELQEEHQHLVMMTANSVDGAEEGYYQQLIKQNERQRTMVETAIDKQYQALVKQVMTCMCISESRVFLIRRPWKQAAGLPHGVVTPPCAPCPT
ncbi:MAG: hypothetical protein II242_03075 [Peptococcaceae bacterium]|nr:hypothetical protein [Peptococcaceae bacterium]